MSSIKGIANNESGITYTLEAIIGVLLIIGTIIYMTGNMPYTAQKTGEDSKVQLMNIGRDNLDLTLYTPESDIIGKGKPMAIYNLTADKTFVHPGETVNFSVYSVYTNELVVIPLKLQDSTLENPIPMNITDVINGKANYSWSYSYSYPNFPDNLSLQNIQALDFAGGWSNYVEIKVGNYNLTSNNNTIQDSLNITGWVNDGINGVSGLKIIIWEYKGSNSFIPANISSNAIDTFTNSTGYYSIKWGWYCNPCNKGLYYISAINVSNGNVSNLHAITYPNQANILCASTENGDNSCDDNTEEVTIQEGMNVSLYMNPSVNIPGNDWWVNFNDSTGYITDINNTNAIFRNSPPGIYYIVSATPQFYPQFQSSSLKTNIVRIIVLPASASSIGETCVNATELNAYMRRYIPLNVNYNLYLIDSTGHTTDYCPYFKEIINGYPTDEAVAVSKLVHIVSAPGDVGKILEYRMELWYK